MSVSRVVKQDYGSTSPRMIPSNLFGAFRPPRPTRVRRGARQGRGPLRLRSIAGAMLPARETRFRRIDCGDRRTSAQASRRERAKSANCRIADDDAAYSLGGAADSQEAARPPLRAGRGSLLEFAEIRQRCRQARAARRHSDKAYARLSSVRRYGRAANEARSADCDTDGARAIVDRFAWDARPRNGITHGL